MNIGIYGGTFNPIHNGHIHLVQGFARQLRLEKVLLIPTLSPPHKHPHELATAPQRLAMCALAAGEVKDVQAVASDIELCRRGKSYTADTVLQLRKIYPRDRLYLLMGEDMFLTLQDWRDPEILFQNCVICTAPRSEAGAEKQQRQAMFLKGRFSGEIKIVEIPYLKISSTEIRAELRQGKDISALVPEKVAAYIAAYKLYQF